MPPAVTKTQVDELYSKLIREKCFREDDPEQNHKAADRLLVGALRQLGCLKTIKAFESVGKYYA
jgi:hypothetical protein